jgi:hypothetical protein
MTLVGGSALAPTCERSFVVGPAAPWSGGAA